MKITILTTLLVILSLGLIAQVGVNSDGSSPDGSAMLDVKSSDKGMLVPRMSTAQRTAISSPATGLLVFDETTGGFWFYNGTAWTDLSAADSDWTISGNDIYSANTGNVGIGTSTPIAGLDINRVGYFDDTKATLRLRTNRDSTHVLFGRLGSANDENFQIAKNYIRTHVSPLFVQEDTTIGSQNIAFGQNGDLSLATSGPGSTPLDRIYIQASGNVGINTSTPDSSAQFEVNSTTKGFLPPRMTANEIAAIVNPVEGLMAYNTDTHRPVYYDRNTWLYYDGVEMLYIGKFFAGGVIFWLDGTGGGLVCAVSDQSAGAEWGCWATLISGADGTAIGTGVQNTIDIEAGCTTTGIAADICANLVLNGYNDWFLPSKDEIHEIFLNITVINATAVANGGTTFQPDFYWSSTEYDLQYAWMQDFDTNFAWVAYVEKDNNNKVRAVRAF